MFMCPTDQARFPKSARYIRCSLPSVVDIPVIARAMQLTGQLDRAAFREAMRWGSQPTILIVPGLDACGSFEPTPGNNTIQIRQSVFEDFEAGRGMLRARAGNVPALGVNILHETVHWGDNRDGIDRKGAVDDEGDEFELLIYGVNLGC